MESTLYEPVKIGYVPSLEIETALANLDGTGVWKAAQPGYPMADFYEAVKEHTFNKSTTLYKGGAIAGVYNSTLLLWPILLRPGTQGDLSACEPVTVNQSARLINNSIAAWASPLAKTAILNGLVGYGQLAVNEPVQLRSILDELSRLQLPSTCTPPEGSRVHLAVEDEADVPVGSPMLHFLTVAITQKSTFPVLPCKAEVGSYQLGRRVQSALQFELGDASGDAVTVLLPDSAESAIETGIREWLTALNAHCRFKSWDASPASGDIVEIEIALAEPNKPPLLIPIRTYQIGMAGLERVLSHVASLAESTASRRTPC